MYSFSHYASSLSSILVISWLFPSLENGKSPRWTIFKIRFSYRHFPKYLKEIRVSVRKTIGLFKAHGSCELHNSYIKRKPFQKAFFWYQTCMDCPSKWRRYGIFVLILNFDHLFLIFVILPDRVPDTKGEKISGTIFFQTKQSRYGIQK